MVWCILLGALTDADMSTTFLMEESDDSGMSGSNEVADANMNPVETVAAFDFGDDDTVRKMGYTGEKRYVRLTITPADNGAGNIFCAVMALMGDADQRPTTPQATSV